MWSGFRILALSLQPLRAKASLTELVVVSRYIERPLCIDGKSIWHELSKLSSSHRECFTD